MNKTLSIFLEKGSAYISRGAYKYGKFYVDKVGRFDIDIEDTEKLKDHLLENYEWSIFDNMNISIDSDILLLDESEGELEYESEREYEDMLMSRYDEPFLTKIAVFENEEMKKELYVSIRRKLVSKYRNATEDLNLRPKYFSPHFSKTAHYMKERKKRSEAIAYMTGERIDISIYEDDNLLYFKVYKDGDMDSVINLIGYFNLQILEKPISKIYCYGRELRKEERGRLEENGLKICSVVGSEIMNIEADEKVIEEIMDEQKYINSILSIY